MVALLMCQCRLLYKNHELTSWVESQFLQERMAQTMRTLKEKAATLAPEVNQAVSDVVSMVKFPQ